MQANPNCLNKLDDCLFRIHHSVNHQCDNTRRMRMLLRLVFADGQVDERDQPVLLQIRALAEDEHNRNLETDALIEDGQDCFTRTEDLFWRAAEEKKRAALASGSVRRTKSTVAER